MGIDKVYHLMAGFLITVVTFIITQDITLAVGASVVGGIGKEIYDKKSGKGTVEALDAVATIFGGGLACGVIYYLVR